LCIARSSETPSSENLLILWLYDDMLARVRRSCTYSCLAIIGHEVKRQSVYGRVTSFSSSSDGPCDHWHLTETQAKALSGRRVCLVEDTDTQPLTRCGAGIGDSTLTFWRFAIAGRWHLAVTDADRKMPFMPWLEISARAL
jgi:hypothetical protein